MSNPIHLLDKTRSALDGDGSEIVPPGLRAVAVLFLSHGRNAWHSTWVRKYHFGNFFRNGHEVQDAVMRRKTPGTVFYMNVLPGFQVSYGNRKFVITEINTFEPFRHINLMMARFGPMACNLSSFLNLIVPTSSLWKQGQSRTNSIIVQEVKDEFIDLAAYSALARGIGGKANPSIGSYKRLITGSAFGENDWIWAPTSKGVRSQRMSLRWYNNALEALMESRERLDEHLH